MLDSIVLETVQAMQAMQLSMSYSTAVTKLSMDSQETAASTIQQMLPPVISDQQRMIDTYA